MYRTAPQILFQFMGGLSITQCAYPVLHDAFTADKADTRSPAVPAAPAASSSSGHLSGLWGAVKWSFRTPSVSCTLSDDIEQLLRAHCWLASLILSLTVVSGGVPALLGSGLGVYCNGGPEGKARYGRLKQRLRDFAENDRHS
ncbi:hypothetical protein LSCM1_08160 [Leishmania martiniquensis]|uniref:Uncharacterized protein n=1 Tax=Leishmania martiniquensis TaxID=1580590 RepID=A0A836I115_9TRYP|nr:hypothetical protein LSCM1_08160 [Leishmania martiniquensis]